MRAYYLKEKQKNNSVQVLESHDPTHIRRISWYNIKQSDGEAPVMQELWRVWSTPSLPLLPGSLLLGVVALDKVLFMS